jgi:imidazole glycerol-phosphate synthase subunit HisH
MVKIAVVDYGLGNLHSVCKGLQAVGADPIVTHSPRELQAAAGVILPGVGAFDPAMAQLQAHGLIEPLRGIVRSGQPFLGICLGLQLLFEGSDEGQAEGLGIIAGRVRRFRSAPGLTIPHMGWNQLTLSQPHCPLWQDLGQHPWVYFVHSFWGAPIDPQVIAATTTHGDQTVVAAVAQDNWMATQFHPEKSATVGLKILANFLAPIAVPA